MVINALNSGAHLFMADFEDSNSPTWENAVEGQINLRDAVKGTISHENDKGKQYRLNEKTAVLIVRPRGWHLEEKHMQVDGKNMSGSLVDFGLYFSIMRKLFSKRERPILLLTENGKLFRSEIME